MVITWPFQIGVVVRCVCMLPKMVVSTQNPSAVYINVRTGELAEFDAPPVRLFDLGNERFVVTEKTWTAGVALRNARTLKHVTAYNLEKLGTYCIDSNANCAWFADQFFGTAVGIPTSISVAKWIAGARAYDVFMETMPDPVPEDMEVPY